MKKYCIGVILLVLSLILLAGTSAMAAEIVASDTFDYTDISWTLDDEGTLIINGSGEMGSCHYEYGNRPYWFTWRDSHEDDVKKVVISEGITTIGNRAFFGCNNLTSITLPSTIETIDECAFWFCSKLENIVFPEGLSVIGDFAFGDCTKLENIVFPEGLSGIGDNAFRDCTKLKNIKLPESLKVIGSYAFYGCSCFTRIEIPESVTWIGEDAFSYCEQLSMITGLPAGVIDGGSEKGAAGTFEYCFYNIADTISVSIQDGTTVIGSHAFDTCYELKSITIPEGVTSIGDYAFNRCQKLYDLNLPESFGDAAWIGAYAFYGCQNLVDVSIPSTVESIGEYAFSACTSLESVSLPENLVTIDDYAFAYCDLQEITLPDSLTYLGKYAFSECDFIKDIRIPDGITRISIGVFYECDDLERVVLPDTLTYISEYAFYSCDNLIHIELPKALTSIGQYAFYYCSIRSLNIPEGVTSIGASAFEISSLSKVTLPDSLTSIGARGLRSQGLSFELVILGADMPTLGSLAFPNRIKTVYCSQYSQAEFWADEKGHSVEYIDKTNPQPIAIDLQYIYGMIVGQKKTAQVTVLPEQASANIVFESSDSSVISIENGVLTAKSVGTASITAKCGTVSDTKRITVYAEPHEFVLGITSCELECGRTKNIHYIMTPMPDIPNIKWTSSASEIVSVKGGCITAHKPGTAVITAVCGSLSATVEVTTYANVESFELSASEIWIVSKETAQLSLKNVYPEGATASYSWSSADTLIAAVDSTGRIEAKAPGETTITVSISSKIKKTCIVHVCYPAESVEFESKNVSISVGGAASLKAIVIDASSGQYVNKLVTFSSSNPSVASVNSNGVVFGNRAGTATITATAANGISASCTVTVKDGGTIKLPSKLKKIDAEAFAGAAFKNVVVPSGCTTIASKAFADSDLAFITMPDSITSIAEDAFNGCTDVLFICASYNSAAKYAEENNFQYLIF